MTIQKSARFAGLCYLINIITGMFSLAYVPGKLSVANNAALTFQNISTSNMLFRLSIASSMLCYISFLLLAVLLYKTFLSTHKTYSQLMLLLVVIGVCLSLITLNDKFTILEFTSNRKYMSGLEPEYLQTQVMLHLKRYNWGLTVCQLFWGLWLLPLGLLILKSKYLPKALGVLLILGSIGYLTDAFASVVFKDFNKYTITNYITLPASIGEIGTCLWLLFFGIKKNKRVDETIKQKLG